MKCAGECGAAAGAGLTVLAIMFLAIIAYLVAGSLTRRHVPVFAPSPTEPRAVPSGMIVLDTVTIDARDTHAWQFFDFDRRSVVLPPDTAGWDLAFQRFQFMTSGTITDLGPVEFDSVTGAPGTGSVGNISVSDSTDAAVGRWYRYSFLSHLLEPLGHVYAVLTSDGHHAKVEFLSYYCPGMVAGCMTIRYSYPLPQPQGRGKGERGTGKG